MGIGKNRMQAEKGTIQIDGKVLRVWTWSGPPPDLPAFLLLHEGLGALELWRGFPAWLAEATGCRVVAYEREGHGGSSPLQAPWPTGWLSREATEILPRVIEVLGLERPILLGHSDGGTIALEFAAAFPDRVSAVVTLAAHVQVDARTLAGVEAAGQAYREGDLASRLAKYHGIQTEVLFRRWHDIWLDPARRDWSIAGALGAIRCPVLALQGSDDAYGEPAQVEIIARATGGQSRLLPGCGHAPHLEAPAAVSEAMEDLFHMMGVKDSNGR